MKKGDRFMANPSQRLAYRQLLVVKRVAKAGTWADIAVTTWACMFSKRQPLVDGSFAFEHEPFCGDPRSFFDAQEEDHIAMLEGAPSNWASS